VGTDGKSPPRAHHQIMLYHETVALSEAHRHDLLADSARLRATRRRRRPSLRFRRGPTSDSR
jgi:hypothetical protein